MPVKWGDVSARLGTERWPRAAALVLAALGVADVVVGGIGALQASLALGTSAASPGLVVARLEPFLRTALLGLAALACVIEIGPRSGESMRAHAARVAPLVGPANGRVLVELAFLLLLAGHRDAMRGELFAGRFGEAQFWGRLALVDLAGPGTLALIAVIFVWAAARWAASAGEGVATSPATAAATVPGGAAVRMLVLGLCLGCIFSIRHAIDRLAGPLYATANGVLIEAWQCWLAAVAISALGLPETTCAGIGEWLGRAWRPVAAIVVLEVLRVVWLEDRHRGWPWLASQREPLAPALVYLRGRVHEWTGVWVAVLSTFVAVLLLRRAIAHARPGEPS